MSRTYSDSELDIIAASEHVHAWVEVGKSGGVIRFICDGCGRRREVTPGSRAKSSVPHCPEFQAEKGR